jgi:hypothetical protein
VTSIFIPINDHTLHLFQDKEVIQKEQVFANERDIRKEECVFKFVV